VIPFPDALVFEDRELFVVGQFRNRAKLE
jgi:hypothetical protein